MNKCPWCNTLCNLVDPWPYYICTICDCLFSRDQSGLKWVEFKFDDKKYTTIDLYYSDSFGHTYGDIVMYLLNKPQIQLNIKDKFDQLSPNNIIDVCDKLLKLSPFF